MNHKCCGIDEINTLIYCAECITYIQERNFLQFPLHMAVTFVICSCKRLYCSVPPASTDAAVNTFTNGQYLVEWVWISAGK